MATIFLIRHGQASFGAQDYDQLSAVGIRQAGILGEALRMRRVRSDRVVCGTMRRHHQTAQGCLEHLRPAGDAPTWDVDAGWDEYDHEDVIGALDPRYRDPVVMRSDFAAADDPRRAFQEMFVRALARWAGGAHDAEYRESWSAFRARVQGALARVRAAVGRSEGALVFTSGGPISAVAGALLGMSDEDTLRLNARLANAAATKLICGGRAVHLSTMNEHGHFEGEHAALMTYR